MARLITQDMLDAARKHCKRRLVRLISDEYTVKLGPAVTAYEYQILSLVDRVGTAPCPRPIDFFTIDGCNVIVLSTIPGRVFGTVTRQLTSEERVDILSEVRRRMDATDRALRSLPGGETERASWSLGDLDGRRCYRFPLLDGFVQRSVDPSGFVDTMCEATAQPADIIRLQRSVLHNLFPYDETIRQGDQVRFCHMDLHLDNILVHCGRLSGIVD